MALDPRMILLAGQGQSPLTNLVQGFQAGQNIRSNMLAQQAAQQKMQQAAALQPLKQQALEQELLAQQEAQARLTREDAVKQRLAKLNQLSQMVAVIEPHIESGNIEAAKSALTSNASLFNPEYVSGMMGDLEEGDIEGLKSGIGDIKRLTGQKPSPKYTGVEVDADSGQVIYTNKNTGETFVEQVNGESKKGGLGNEQLNTLVSDLPPAMQSKAKAAYHLAGGGKDGVKAINKFIEDGSEIKRRADAPEILSSAYPKASTEELKQLQAVVDAGKTVESGLKEAAKVREEQRRFKKAKSFQDRAVSLMTSILNNDQLGDVLGSVEGSYSFRFSDAESELIQDIEEAQNILTADNMDLMTGVLSESDIALLKNLSSGGLSRKRSEPRFRKDVQSIIDKLSGARIPSTGDDTVDIVLPNGVPVKRIRGGVRG